MTQSSHTKTILSVILYIIVGILIFGISLIGFSARWAFTNWAELDVDEIIFQIKSPLEGTGNGMIKDFILQALLPAIIILVVYVIILVLLKKGKRRIICSCIFLAAVIAAGFFVKKIIWERLNMDTWVEGQIEQSDFIQEQYVNPADVQLTFPDQKRNLIFIYLESMETTYSDRTSGGAFEKNIIPELTQIAMDNEDFSGYRKTLDGGLVFPGTGFTSGALFAQTAGLPLKVSIGGNNMDTQESFFPEVIALGDILAGQGYRQVFILGSDATFGGRRLYYVQHGGFEIRDYYYGQENQWIAPDYDVWWGFEDEILFRNAKDTLLELAEGEEPFNMTLLTVDTHFENGYICNLCGNEFDDQYANVMACSSKQVSEFLSWIQEQDFYENTTVIISGDHTTMDKDFCEHVDNGYQRKTFTAFVNSPVEPEDPNTPRTYSTFDIFPTTLAALGVEIEGNRLGLGTNLYSTETTLVEEFGTEYLTGELSRKSEFLAQLEHVDGDNADALLKRYQEYMKNSLKLEDFDEETGIVSIRVDENLAAEIIIDHLDVEYQESGKSKVETVELTPDPDTPNSHIGILDISNWAVPIGEIRVNLYNSDGLVYENVVSEYVNYVLGDPADFIGYFHALSEHPEYTVFLAICDEGTEGLTYEMLDAMWETGIQTYLIGAARVSYFAVIENGTAIEMNGYEPLHYDGVLADSGVGYTIESAGYYNGSYASIVIGGKEYAQGNRGMNVVVYDTENQQVIDSVCFDTYLPQEEW